MTHKQFTSLCFHLVCILSVLLAVALFPVSAAAQSLPEPNREQLLNGLSIFFWPRPADANVFVRMRINSGAAFDFAGKAGTMALLGDALFPDPATREYVTEQLGGRLDVVTTHDAIDITISGKASEFERIVELVRNAMIATQLTPENIARIREARIKQLSAKPLTISDVADQAIAQRLLGNFPYAHRASGTPETVSKVDRADLMISRERFLNADNAAVAIIGGVEKARAIRALRQLLGPWNKADRTVPATFRQADAPDARVLVVNQSDTANAEIRLAVRGLARSDRDGSLVAAVLAQIVRDRWQAAAADLSSVFARHEAHVLPGIFVMGASAPVPSVAKAIAAAQQVMKTLSQGGPTVAELERARNEVLAENSGGYQTDSLANAWLDMVTFKTASPNTLEASVRRLTVVDIQRVATRLFKDAPVATVVVGNQQQLKAALGPAIELREDPKVNSAADSSRPTRKP